MAEWKKDEKGNFVADGNGNPVWADDAGEYPVIGTGLREKNEKIASLSGDNAELKARIRKMEATFTHFDGIDDIAGFVSTAKANADKLAKMDGKDKADAEAIQRQIQEAVQAATAPIVAERDKFRTEYEKTAQSLNSALIGGAFLNSKFVAEKLVSPAIAQELFSKHFAVQDGQLVALNAEGKPRYDGDGKFMSFDEAIQNIVKDSPHAAYVLKSAPGGAGSQPSNGVNTQANPWDPKARNVTQQMEIYKQDPARAKAMAKEHGITLP